MRRAAAVAVVLLLSCAGRAHAWGFEAHKFIMDRAIALLPAEIRPFFELTDFEMTDETKATHERIGARLPK